MGLIATKTIVDAVNAGGFTEWMDVRRLEDIWVLVENASNQQSDFTFEGAVDASGTGGQNISGSTILTLPATTGKGVMKLSSFPGFIRIKQDPAAAATGTATCYVNAEPRRK